MDKSISIIVKTAVVFILGNMPNYVFAESNSDSALRNDTTCISDYSVNQKANPHHLSRKQLQYLNELRNRKLISEAYKQLAAWGDEYGVAAYAVVTEDVLEGHQLRFHNIVQNHWDKAVGPEVRQKYFHKVAVQHFSQYLQILNTGVWPDSDQILNSYIRALVKFRIDPSVAIDLDWQNSIFHGFATWQSLIKLRAERVVNRSNVCASVDGIKATFRVLSDIFEQNSGRNE